MSPVALTTTAPHATRLPELVDIIDFKWLMAAEGHRVHVERLQSDPGYARNCLSLASRSPTDPLRDVARRLLAVLA